MRFFFDLMWGAAVLMPVHDATTVKKDLYVDQTSHTESRKEFRKNTFHYIRSACIDYEFEARKKDSDSAALKGAILQAMDFLDVLAQEDKDDWCDEGGARIQEDLTILLEQCQMEEVD